MGPEDESYVEMCEGIIKRKIILYRQIRRQEKFCRFSLENGFLVMENVGLNAERLRKCYKCV